MTKDPKRENFEKAKYYLDKVNRRLDTAPKRGLNSGEVLNALFDVIAAQRYLENLTIYLDI